MRAVVQVVKNATLIANCKPYSNIEKGFVVLLGVKVSDNKKDAEYIASKIEKLRVFEDENGKLNLSLKDVNGSVMIVSNFTLYGTTIGQNRPSFINSAKPEISKPLYDYTVQLLKQNLNVQTGVFGADMQVDLSLDGPCTILIDSEKSL